MTDTGQLTELGWDSDVARDFDAFVAARSTSVPVRPARVVRADRGWVMAADGEGVVHAKFGRRLRPRPVTGDWVALAADGDEVVVTGVLERRGLLVRSNGREDTEAQVLAAGIDVVAIVCAMDRPLKRGRIDRFLALAHDAGARPVIVLTKPDLVAAPDGIVAAARSLVDADRVHVVNGLHGVGIDAVRTEVSTGETMALVGESGVGKSTLVNALVGAEVQGTAAVRDGDRKGRHTTTSRDLLVLPGGGVVLDTPGMRSVGLWEGSSGLAEAFGDVEELAEACRFRDCAHQAEPGCAVRAAVDSGALSADRLASYQRLLAELDAVADRQEVTRRRRVDRGPVRRAGRTGQRAVRAATDDEHDGLGDATGDVTGDGAHEGAHDGDGDPTPPTRPSPL